MIDEPTARSAVVDAARQLGLSAEGLRVLRAGHRGVVELPAARRVARVGPSYPVMQRELRFAAVAAREGLPFLQPIDSTPLVWTDWGTVTFWPRVDAKRGGRPCWEWLGGIARRLHALPAPEGPSNWDPVQRILERVRTASPVRALEEAAESLRRACEGVAWAGDPARLEGPRSLIHGDLSPSNVLCRDARDRVVIDYDLTGAGPSDWDLTVPLVHARRFGLSDSEAGRFFVTYGSGPPDSPEFRALVRLRELLDASFALQVSALRREGSCELKRRMRCCADPDDDTVWMPLGRA